MDTPVPIPEPPADPPLASPPPPPEQPPRRPRRRGRTTLLIAAAAVLGVLAGTGAGYQIQYKRPDTPLPPLSQPELKQPKGAAPSGEPLTAAEDTLVKFDGDLRKLLIAKPKGAKDLTDTYAPDGWMSLYDYSETYKKPDNMFRIMVNNDFRRLATSSWSTGSYDTLTTTEVRLVQFRDETQMYTAEMLDDQKSYMPEDEFAGNTGKDIPDSGDGTAWVYSKPWTKAGYLPQYQARALARRGTVMVDVWLWSAKPIRMSTIQSLAKRQLERL